MAPIEVELRRVADELIARRTPHAWGGGTLQGPSRGFSDSGGPADAAGDYQKIGFDAGSLARYLIHAVFGIEIPRNTFAQFQFGTEVAEPKPGDLVYPQGHDGCATVYLGGGIVLAAGISGQLIRTERLQISSRTRFIRVVSEQSQRAVTDSGWTVRARMRPADIRQALSDLLDEWGRYRLDTEAWYITKPLLHDVTGTVPTTVAYEKAMQNLIAAVDDLRDDASQDEIDAAATLADTAWSAWHEANEYAAQVGLGDRTPTERAALQRLGKLVERLTRCSSTDPELALIKREIQSCLDRVNTVSVSWVDITELPAIEAAGLIPQLTA
ncbi:hypothetical protein BKG82_26190 [Mycobacteroides chelonae]|uniref:NlpC/P60 domain-containing protein n=2 Tax=Mycobacteroides chelonae TaxID=1774 RepID=A0A1S1LFQ6_MYCCH|nr:hypothetical protein BKG82_26190 [Mycobacteroides chelonae]